MFLALFKLFVLRRTIMAFFFLSASWQQRLTVKILSLCLFLLFGGSVFAAKSGQELVVTPSTKAATEEPDFLFLAEEEPENKKTEEEAVEPDTADEEVIEVAPAIPQLMAPQSVLAKTHWPEKEKKPFSEHRKIEDINSDQLPPNFCIRKKMGCFNLSGKFLPDGYWAQSTKFLNKCFEEDRNFLVRHTFDLNVEAVSATELYGERTAELKMTIRNKGTWGLPGSVAVTAPATVSAAGVTFGEHVHGLSRHVLWLREVWLSTQLNAVFRTDPNMSKHYFKLGLFPFWLGRGISLGAVYNATPGLVGFYSDNSTDQFAPGMLFTGEFIKDRVKYDLYGAILQNFAANINQNLVPIYSQAYGRQATPERGFGHVNWLIATRMELIPLKSDKWGTLEFEPYVLYNQVPEQRIDAPADAAAKLGTSGFELDYSVGPFETSFEFSHNFGRQAVHGWDNNQSVLANQNGTVVVANSKVTDTITGLNALVTTANQAFVNAGPQAEAQNGQLLGTSTMRNAVDRYSNPFVTKFRGWMMVGEAAYWFYNKQLAVAFGGGIATGDENPNVNAEDVRAPLPDGKYQGFIGLQEAYTGELVESAYFLGLRSVARPLTLPDNAIARSFYSSQVSEFTNLVYLGTGLHCKPKWKSKFYARPNIIAFWQQDATNRFDSAHGLQLNQPASNFYGLELNLFFDIFPLDFLKNTLVAGLFLPGSHFSEIKGIPLNSDQVRMFRVNPTNVPNNRLLGDDKAFFFNLRMEYRF
jgi:hypothetical protein